MPKMKTRRCVAKRFRLTKKGKIKRSRAFSGHIMTKKSSKRKRYLKRSTIVSKADEKKLRKQMPYW
ncbi:MAG: 50S ribosomal protein L35 [Candidatus Omnitrophica bacterium]|nr:50S ribosomal protein L35 [Candidatus Omnitrophota bacterium]